MNEYAFDHRSPKFRGQPRRKPVLNFGPRGYLKLMGWGHSPPICWSTQLHRASHSRELGIRGLPMLPSYLYQRTGRENKPKHDDIIYPITPHCHCYLTGPSSKYITSAWVLCSTLDMFSGFTNKCILVTSVYCSVSCYVSRRWITWRELGMVDRWSFSACP